jgi:copper transport protein
VSRRGVTLVLAALIALVVPAAAFAHATLEHTYPSFRERVTVSPTRIVLRFDQDVSAVPGSIQVLEPNGDNVARAAHASGRELAAAVQKLRKGPYTVRWRAVSNDGHVISGVYTFGVRYVAPPVTEAVGAQGPTRTEDIVRWAYFLALALLVGGLGTRLLIARGPLPERAERRFYLLVGIGAVGVLEVGILAFLLRAEDALQLSFGDFLYGDLSPLSSGTRFGQTYIVTTLGFAFALAFLFLAWLTDRRVLLWPAFALALLFSAGLSLSGHSAGEPNSSWLSELADYAHLTAAMLWIGGLVTLVAVVWPAAPERRREVFLRFSRFATALVAVVIAAGTYLSIERLPRLTDLWASGYGRTLLAKLALVGVALLWGAMHHFVARPLVERRPTNGLLARLPRSLLGESIVGMAVLLVAAVLVNAKPPPQRPLPTPATQVASNVPR